MSWRPWPPTQAIESLFPPEEWPYIAQTRIEVRIWTAGLKYVGTGGLRLNYADRRQKRELLDDARSFNTTNGRPVRHNFFRECLECSDVNMGENDIVYQIDARPFHDPERVRGRINHLGQSGPVMLGVAKDPAFGQWFYNQVRAIVSAAKELARQDHRSRGRLHVVSFCRAGRHRSVAVACLLGDLIHQHSRWRAPVNHLASDEWIYGTCNQCPQCLHPTGENAERRLRARRLAELAFRWAFYDACLREARPPPGH